MITRKKFIEGNFSAKGNKRKTHPVTILLRDKSHLAFKIKEISKVVKMKENTVRSMLRVLIKNKLVEHKPPYFAWRISNTKKKR